MRISISQLGDFRDCPQSWKYGNIDKRRPIRRSDAISFGVLSDDFTGIYWEDGLDAAVAWLKSQADRIEPLDAAKIAALTPFYHDRTAEIVKQFKVIGNQVERVVPIRNPATGYPMRDMELIVKIDTELERNGKVIVREHKTTTQEIRGFDSYWQRVHVDSQVSIYALAMGADAVLYDVIRRPMLRLSKDDKKADDPLTAYVHRLMEDIDSDQDRYFQIRTIYKTDHDMQRVAWSLYHQACALRDMVKTGSFYRNSNHCVGRYGACPYLGVCTGTQSLDDNDAFYSYGEPLPLAI